MDSLFCVDVLLLIVDKDIEIARLMWKTCKSFSKTLSTNWWYTARRSYINTYCDTFLGYLRSHDEIKGRAFRDKFVSDIIGTNLRGYLYRALIETENNEWAYVDYYILKGRKACLVAFQRGDNLVPITIVDNRILGEINGSLIDLNMCSYTRLMVEDSASSVKTIMVRLIYRGAIILIKDGKANICSILETQGLANNKQ